MKRSILNPYWEFSILGGIDKDKITSYYGYKPYTGKPVWDKFCSDVASKKVITTVGIGGDENIFFVEEFDITSSLPWHYTQYEYLRNLKRQIFELVKNKGGEFYLKLCNYDFDELTFILFNFKNSIGLSGHHHSSLNKQIIEEQKKENDIRTNDLKKIHSLMRQSIYSEDVELIKTISPTLDLLKERATKKSWVPSFFNSDEFSWGCLFNQILGIQKDSENSKDKAWAWTIFIWKLFEFYNKKGSTDVNFANEVSAILDHLQIRSLQQKQITKHSLLKNIERIKNDGVSHVIDVHFSEVIVRMDSTLNDYFCRLLNVKKIIAINDIDDVYKANRNILSRELCDYYGIAKSSPDEISTAELPF